MTAEYANALEVSRKAAAKYMAIRKDYFAGKIDYVTFLIAQREDKAASAAFDAAFNKEEELSQDENEIAVSVNEIQTAFEF